MKKKVIALTGGIAVGKSTVSDYLKSLGYEVIDADLISREIAAEGTEGLAQIIAVFGEKYMRADGSLDRKALGAHVFADPAELKRLEEITIPLIEQEIDKKVAESMGETVFVDGATIIENGLQGKFAEIWVVGTDEKTQLERLRARDNLSEDEAFKRVQSQMPLAEKRKYAQVYLDNSGTIKEIYSQVDQALKDEGISSCSQE